MLKITSTLFFKSPVGLALFSYSFVNLVFGLFRTFLFCLVLKGMGFKFLGLQRFGVLVKLGFSHRIFFKIPNDIKIYYKTKQLFFVKSRSFFLLKKILYSFFKLKKILVYKRKGIVFKGSIFFLKQTSKKLKF